MGTPVLSYNLVVQTAGVFFYGDEMMTCARCDGQIDEKGGEPYLMFCDMAICTQCQINLLEAIYKMAGTGDGGMIHLVFAACLHSKHNRNRRTQIRQYKKILKELLEKYKFTCVLCGSQDNLTIDHIWPFSKGGGDEISNLQILCKSCNSSKGAKTP